MARVGIGEVLEPFRFKHLVLKNRMVKAPYVSTYCDERGYVLDSAVYHYEAIAKGGEGSFHHGVSRRGPIGRNRRAEDGDLGR